MLKIQYIILSSLFAISSYADTVLPHGVSLFISAQGLKFFQNNPVKLNELSKGTQTKLRFSLSDSKKPEDQVDVLLTLAQAGALPPDYLSLQFDSEIKQSAMKLPGGVVDAPNLQKLKTKKHDAAVGIRFEMINQIAEYMYEQDLLRVIDVSGPGQAPDYVELTAPPLFSTDPKYPAQAILHIELEKPMEGFFTGMVFKRPLPIAFDMLVKSKIDAKNQLVLKVEKILFKTLEVDTSAARAFRGKTIRQVKSILQSMADNKETVAVIPTMNDIMDIPVKVIDAQASENYLMLFTNFVPAKTAPKPKP